ncbi:MAG: hypothetical protein KF819_38900 [Labilithrix sp.]|nr:hypothetical protein [Labilithrix sp.]
MSRAASFVALDATRRTLHVKGGIWFDETLPLDAVAAVTPGTWPWWGGLGVKTGPLDTIGVVGSRRGVVAIRFVAPMPLHLVVAVSCSGLLVSLEEPDAFIRATTVALERHASGAFAAD